MGTLRKFDPRQVRESIDDTFSNERNDSMRLHERVTKIEAVLPTLATKEDLAREVGGLRSDMHLEFGKVRQEMSTEFSNVRQEMSTEFGKVRQEMSAEFGKVRHEMGAEFAKVRKEVSAEIACVKEDVHELRQTVFSEIHGVRTEISGLRVEMHQAIGAMTWRLIGTLITVCTALVAATYFISKDG
ncbi:coiled-coil domain-containing protein [Pandoraea pneumonica]|uniref:coiled-coil domain-containing protein n=1 Tax=Pandoraea pneumonica TaxID=2508299 RepID=UPI003CF3EA35